MAPHCAQTWLGSSFRPQAARGLGRTEPGLGAGSTGTEQPSCVCPSPAPPHTAVLWPSWFFQSCIQGVKSDLKGKEQARSWLHRGAVEATPGAEAVAEHHGPSPGCCPGSPHGAPTQGSDPTTPRPGLCLAALTPLFADCSRDALPSGPGSSAALFCAIRYGGSSPRGLGQERCWG